MKNKKTHIGGKEITRRQALRGLGHPKNWANLEKKVKAEFRQKSKDL